MTIDDATPVMTRRAFRAHRERTTVPTGSAPASVEAPLPVPPPESPEDQEPAVQWADSERPATALLWLETADVIETTLPADLDAAATRPSGDDLLAGTRSGLLRTRWLVPLGTLALCTVAYGASMLLWPLHAVAPVASAVEVRIAPAAASDITWPSGGSSGVGIAGVSSVASATGAVPIASVTKVVSSLMVLDRLPLALGEQGPEYAFTYADSVEYWDYRVSDQSALDVPVDGVLTEYQLLQGTLLGSANNYIDRLAREIWGSDAQFAAAAKTWLADRGLSDITIVTPSGFDDRNTATPAALLKLGERAMQNPVFAEIVGTKSVELPGAGVVTNTNGMLGDAGVVGIKTGTLGEDWNLLTAKDVTVDDVTVHLYAAVLGQDDDKGRLAATRSLFTQVEADLTAAGPTVAAGTVVGRVQTDWGTTVDIVTDDDATVVQWNGATSAATVTLDLMDQWAEGDDVGTLAVHGPVDAETVDVSLAEEVTGPSPWWRLTHPLQLLGIITK
ncbi:D-alanyl-D-alanine carboxypeptidase [Microbacterium sp. NPDC077644]|uniref:D-alanyl-D-alanine carboxypeptidase family protein n=1 Tax=Microbacterium sp. NPDC077644 TaxID=3155055 RepID=UPI00344D826B